MPAIGCALPQQISHGEKHGAENGEGKKDPQQLSCAQSYFRISGIIQIVQQA